MKQGLVTGCGDEPHRWSKAAILQFGRAREPIFIDFQRISTLFIDSGASLASPLSLASLVRANLSDKTRYFRDPGAEPQRWPRRASQFMHRASPLVRANLSDKTRYFRDRGRPTAPVGARLRFFTLGARFHRFTSIFIDFNRSGEHLWHLRYL